MPQQQVNLQIFTQDTPSNDGTILPGFTVSVTPEGDLAVTMATWNAGDLIWTSGNPYVNGVLDSSKYTLVTGKLNLKNFIRFDIMDSNGVSLMQFNPVLADMYEEIAMSDPTLFPYHESTDGSEGFWLSPHWANPTSQDNGNLIGDQLQTIPISGLPAGQYKVVVWLDPNNLWGQIKSYSLFFTVQGGAIAMQTTLKTLHGKGKK